MSSELIKEYGEPLPLTEQEKWECTVRWLNACYRHFVFPNDYSGDPCPDCPLQFRKCFRCDHKTGIQYISDNFRVLEQFTGDGTVVGHCVSSGL